MIDKLKYRKLYNEMVYLQSEVELINAEISEVDTIFTKYIQEFCTNNDIEIEEHPKNEKLFKQPKRSDYTTEDKKTFSKLYKQIAKKIHPDKFANRPDSDYFEDRFKELSTAFDDEEWATILRMAKEERIQVDKETMANLRMQKIINDLRVELKHKKSQYNWLFRNCGEDENCKQKLAKDLIKRLYNVEVNQQ